MNYLNQGEDRSTIDLASPDIRGRPTGEDDNGDDNYDNKDNGEGDCEDGDDGDNGDDGNDEGDDDCDGDSYHNLLVNMNMVGEW